MGRERGVFVHLSLHFVPIQCKISCLSAGFTDNHTGKSLISMLTTETRQVGNDISYQFLDIVLMLYNSGFLHIFFLHELIKFIKHCCEFLLVRRFDFLTYYLQCITVCD